MWAGLIDALSAEGNCRADAKYKLGKIKKDAQDEHGSLEAEGALENDE